MPKEMDLKLRILARGSQALRALKRVHRHVSRIVSVTSKVSQVGRSVFTGLFRSARLALRPLRLMRGVMIGLVATMALLGGKSLFAAGDVEALRLRLDGVTASAQQSNRIFKETLRLSVFSPFTPEEMIDARIGLLNIGQTSKKAIMTLGDAASITQRPLVDLVSLLASLETEPLRRVGIELKRESGKFEFTFRDKMQRVKHITAKGIDEARKSLLSIFHVKYGGGMTRFAKAWKGLISTLQGNIRLAMANFGEGMFPAAKKFVDGINTKLTQLIDSGKLTKWGEKVADKLVDVWDRGQAVFRYAAGVLDAMKEQGSKAWADALKTVLLSGGEIVAISFVNYLRAMGNVFSGIGKLISGAFIEDILKLDLPGTVNTRRRLAGAGLAEMSAEEYGAFVKKHGIGPGHEFTVEQEAELAASRRGKMLESGVADFKRAFVDIRRETSGAITNILRTAQNDLSRVSGYTGPSAEDYYQQIRAKREAAKQPQRELVTARRMVYRQVSPSSKLIREAHWQTKQVEAEAGRFEKGQRVGAGYTVVKIENLTVRANDLKHMQNQILMAASKPALAAAGT